MKKDKVNIIKILLKNQRVNNYTKLLIKLKQLDFYEDYYIPNRKLMNQLGLTKKWIIILLHQLEEDRIIKVFYKNRKRFFTFIATSDDEEEKVNQYTDYDELYDDNVDLEGYNWLEDEE